MRVLISTISTAFALLTAPPAHAFVELHAHLFMNEGMTWAFCGDFKGPIQADSWDDGLSSQVNPETLNASGIRILVASLYAHPLFTWTVGQSLRDSIRSQIRMAEEFVAQNPEWIIARDPFQAELALQKDQRVMILSLEGASGIIESETDIQEFVVDRGIRILTLLHLTDDALGGAAFMKGIKFFSNPVQAFQTLLSGASRANDTMLNPNGLTAEGRALTAKLIRQNVWIDLAHASDATQRDIFSLMRKSAQPPLYTHTVARHFHGAERGISDQQIEFTGSSGGVIGLMPSEEMLEGAYPSESSAQTAFKKCTPGLTRLKRQFEYFQNKGMPAASLTLGSDFNGAVSHLSPTCGTGTRLDQEGFFRISHTETLWESLGSPTPRLREKTFIEAWKKVFYGKRDVH